MFSQYSTHVPSGNRSVVSRSVAQRLLACSGLAAVAIAIGWTSPACAGEFVQKVLVDEDFNSGLPSSGFTFTDFGAASAASAGVVSNRLNLTKPLSGLVECPLP